MKIILLLLILFPILAQAWEIVDDQHVMVHTSYTEPAQYLGKDGKTLYDLNQTEGLKEVMTYCDVGGTIGFYLCDTASASSPLGGASTTRDIVIPIPIGQKVTTRYKALASLLTGGISGDSNIVELVIDRTNEVVVEPVPKAITDFTTN